MVPRTPTTFILILLICIGGEARADSVCMSEDADDPHFDNPTASFTRLADSELRIDLNLYPTDSALTGHVEVYYDLDAASGIEEILEDEARYTLWALLDLYNDGENWNTQLRVNDGFAPIMIVVNSYRPRTPLPSCGLQYYLLIDPAITANERRGTFGQFSVVRRNPVPSPFQEPPMQLE